jgi:hypothetical protein
MLPVTVGACGGTSVGVACPGLISVQMADQCLGHALKRSHHPDHISNCYLLLSENLLASLGVRPLRCGCYWRHHASSPSTRRLPLRCPLTMITCTHTINSISNSIIKSNHVNESRSESQVAGRTRSDTICNEPPRYDDNLL